MSAAALPAPAAAQERVGGRSEIFVGSELENYLRLLQSGGVAAAYPWTIRGFGPHEVDRLLPADGIMHPWVHRYELDGGRRAAVVDFVAPQARAVYNSAFPYGGNNGAVWEGRGLTTAVQFGIAVRLGPFSLTAAPVAFRAENEPFELFEDRDRGAVANGRQPELIDLPERFGESPYGRVDPGQSTLRLDLAGIAAGLSTANQQWGPAREHPIILGNNAPGFLHGFVGTSTPANVWIGRIHGRMVWGRLDQSAHSPAPADASRRFMAGLVGMFSPRGIPGLEIGASRFFHQRWPAGGLTADEFLKPVESFLKGRLPDTGAVDGDPKTDFDNQLASAFIRWAFPRSGVELYGEYGREDHSWNLRDFILEPDHSGGYLLGISSTRRQSDTHWLAVRAELLNLQVSHIARVRNQWPFYVHGWIPQGHTHRGQLLGSAAGYGGAASLVATDLYHPGGRWTLSWSRAVRQDRGIYSGATEEDARGIDVMHGLGMEGLVFLGHFDLTAGVTGAYNFNRNFADDALNLQARAGVRVAW